MADLLAEHQFGVAREGLELLSEDEAAVVVARQEAAFEHRFDELPEQGPIVELRRLEFVQQRDSLGGEDAKLLELAAIELARAVLDQNRHGDEVALEGLQQGAPEQAKVVAFVTAAGRTLQHVAGGAQQFELDECVDAAFHHAVELFFRPGQEQFTLEEGIDGTAEAAQPRAAHALGVEEAARNPGADCQQVGGIVAEVGQQHRARGVGADDVAQAVLLALDDAQLEAVLDDLSRRHARDRDAVGVAAQTHHVLEHADHLLQVVLVERVLAARQQCGGQQVDRVDVRRAVDIDHDAFGQVVDHVAEPGRLAPVVEFFLAPGGVVVVEHALELDRLAEAHRDLAIVLAQDIDEVAEVRQGLRLLLLPGELRDIGAALGQALVADVDGLEQQRPRGIAQEGAHGDRKHPSFRRQQAAGARARAFDEVLQRHAPVENQRDVLVEDRGIQRLGSERTAQEEGPAAAQERPHEGHVEIDAGGDVRRHEPAVVEQVGQQHVVDVAAVAGHVDDLVARLCLAELAEMVHDHAAVDPAPEPGQEQVGDSHEGVGVVCRDLAGVLARDQLGLVFADVVAPRLGCDRLLHGLRSDHALDKRSAMRSVRADSRRAHALEVHAQHAADAAQGLGAVLGLGQHLAHVHRLAELDHGGASVDDRRKEAAHAAGHAPVLGEQDLEDAFFLVGRASDEHGHRHDLHLRDVGGVGMFEKLAQHLRVPPPLRPADQDAAVASRGPVGARQHALAHPKRLARPWPAQLAADFVDDQQRGQGVGVEHVENRPLRVDLEFREVFGQYGGAHPPVQDAPEQVQPGAVEPGRQAD